MFWIFKISVFPKTGVSQKALLGLRWVAGFQAYGTSLNPPLVR